MQANTLGIRRFLSHEIMSCEYLGHANLASMCTCLRVNQFLALTNTMRRRGFAENPADRMCFAKKHIAIIPSAISVMSTFTHIHATLHVHVLAKLANNNKCAVRQSNA